jgi:phosphohistidine phosphatase
MKTLYIIRHGKSSWDDEGLQDFDRPLNERGYSNAQEMAKRLDKKKLLPEIIVTSTANRALSTARIFSEILNVEDHKIYLTEELYLASVNQIMDVIYRIDDQYHSAMIFGHNPGFTELANHLSSLSISNLPTAGIVMINFDVEKWTGLSRQKSVDQFFDFPKNI